jgi:hypothetical protein
MHEKTQTHAAAVSIAQDHCSSRRVTRLDVVLDLNAPLLAPTSPETEPNMLANTPPTLLPHI